MLQLDYQLYTLRKRHVFRISRGSRMTTPVLFTAISYQGVTGFGEASMPALYGESHESAERFMSKVDLSSFKNPVDIESIMHYIDDVLPGNTAAKASIDIALHDLVGKLAGKPCYQLLNFEGVEEISTSMTIGIDTAEVVKKRVKEAEDFKYLKIKLGLDNDQEIIQAVRDISDRPLFIDANQGWKDKNLALDRIKWLEQKGAVFIEQPMPLEMKSELNWLKSRSPLPIIGDEGVQRLIDVEEADEFYHGINIKLVKCTGLNEAVRIIDLAESKQLKVMLGCMSESSCGISAAFQLASRADYIDLDGNLGLLNDPFKGIEQVDGKLQNNDVPGIGLIRPETSWRKMILTTNPLS